MNVLVAEKDPLFLSYVVELIQRWGYRAEKAETASQTLKKVEEKGFDLVLLDTSLPNMTVKHLVAELKAIRPEIKIVTMTGANTKELEAEIRTLGIIYYMLKPVNEQVLKEILDHISRKKREGSGN